MSSFEVNLSAQELEAMAWEAYLQDGKLQAEVKRQNEKIPAPRYTFGITREQLSDMIYRFKEYVFRELCKHFTRLREYTPSKVMRHTVHILETKTVAEVPDGITTKRKSAHPNEIITKVYIEINFNTETLRYPSLNPSRFPNGVDNIILLITNGWNYTEKKRPPFGEWHGKFTRGWSQRNPNDFLETIIEEYNERQSADTQMKALLSPQYRAYGSGLDSIKSLGSKK